MKKKNYTLSLPEHLIHRAWVLRDTTKFNPNKEIEAFLSKIVEEKEKELGLGPYDWQKTEKCNKCGSYMKKVKYKGKDHWGCPKYPDCKNLKPYTGN